MSASDAIPGPEMGATARPVTCWGLPLWSLAPLLSVLLPGFMRTLGLLLLPITMLCVWLSKRSGLPIGWLYGMVLAGLPLPLSFAVADEGALYPSPCDQPDPPAWCASYQPPSAEYAPGTLAPRLPARTAGRAADEPGGPARWLLASTVAEPPPVLWVGGVPDGSVRLFGNNRARHVDRALELILPEGWQVFASPSPQALAERLRPPLIWNGDGRGWPDVLEDLAARYGLSLVADVRKREITITDVLAAPAAAFTDGFVPAETEPLPRRTPVVTEIVPPAASDPQQTVEAAPPPAVEAPSAAPAPEAAAVAAAPLRAEPEPPEPVVGFQSHPLYTRYSTPEWLTVKPLPATRAQVASRLVPPGVEIDMSILGSLQTSPVYEWNLESVKVSPQNALKKVLPDGYCVGEDAFPELVIVPCPRETPAGAGP